MMQVQAEFGQIVELVRSAGPWGITAYLIYKDLYKPWRNGKSNGKAGTTPACVTCSPKDFATEKDVSLLAASFREFRAESQRNHGEFLERLVRVETKVDSFEWNKEWHKGRQ